MRLRKCDWKVSKISMSAAARLVKRHHYAGTASKVAVSLHGLYHAQDTYCVLPYGVCWWLPLPSPSAARFFHSDWRGVLNLSRMVLTPDAPANAASFLLSRSIKMLPDRWHTLATYADASEEHTGTVYRAANWTYLGITDSKPRWIDADGNMVSVRCGTRKTLTHAEMLAAGYTIHSRRYKHRFAYYRHQPVSQVRQLALAI